MEIECVKEKLEEAVSQTAPVTGKNLSLPVLECVLLVAKDNSLIVRATNLDLGVEVSLPVKVKKPGTTAVSADILKNFLSNLPNDDSVKLSVEETTLNITTTHTETRINTRDYEEFPSIPQISDGEKVNIPADKLVSGFKSVYYSASTGSMKPELSSVNMFINDGALVFVATDSFRLAEKRINVKKIGEFSSVLVPFENVSEIVRAYNEKKGSIEMVIGENQVSFLHENTYITSRIIDGVFPDYTQIIPDEQDTEVVVLKQDLLNTLKLSHIFSDKFNKITVKVDPSEKVCEVETHNAEIGENTGSIDASLSGKDITASFNYRYVVDCFQSISTDSVSLELSQNKPMVIRGVGDKTFMYLVMPMNK